jgi:phage N-6-adenine-methyltransferase
MGAVMNMPLQKPGRSKQDYGTPRAFIAAVERRWGPLAFDLAASSENHKAPKYFTEADNSLKQDWFKLDGLLWLNPPFSNLEDWAEKCYQEQDAGAKIIMLTPASVGSNWYAKHCFDAAHTVFIRPRLTFEGCTDPYPKDCMLTVWGFVDELPGHCSIWDWRGQ